MGDLMDNNCGIADKTKASGISEIVFFKKSISQLRDKWLEFEKNNKLFTAYQSYDLSESILKTYIPYRVINKENPFFLEACKSDNKGGYECIAIIPLASSGSGTVTFGYSQSMPVYDFIWKPGLDKETMGRCVEALLKKYPGIVISLVREESFLYEFLSEKYKLDISRNVGVDIKSSAQEWFAGLSKSVRQNIRTSYNRAVTDGVKFDFRMEKGKDLSKDTFKKIMDTYVSRRKSFSDGLSKPKELMIRYCQYNTRAMTRLDTSIVATLWQGDTLAAFWTGYFSPAGESVTVPRLSINPVYSRYSPGSILINESIKELHKSYPQIKVFDLSSGTEKYKYDMGGVEYNTYTFDTASSINT